MRKRAGLYIDDTLLAGLEALKVRDGIPASEAVRRALADYLQKCGIKIPVRAPATRAKRRAR